MADPDATPDRVGQDAPGATTRRDFLGVSAAALGAPWLAAIGGARGAPRAGADLRPPVHAPRRILILGGTGFIGPPEVRHALERGHEVTLFNRGVTNPDLFADVEQLRGDRNGDLDILRGRQWDVVIDNHATLPSWVRDAATLLSDQVGHYVFISTLSVYKDPVHAGTDEYGSVYTVEDWERAVAAGESPYGANKAQAEREAQRAFPDRCTVIRPGLIVGPGDPSDRFTYWPVRIDRGGEVLAPGDGSSAVQVVDVRDLTRFIVHVAEQASAGVMNATGPRTPYSMAEFLHGIRAVTSAEVQLTWVAAPFLLERGVRPWSDLPVWRQGPSEGVLAVDVERAFARGLSIRPLAETARDTLEWWRTLPEERRSAPEAGLDAAREREVLAAWHARSAGVAGGPP